ncbi:MAG: NEW3 domain-containing protein [Acidimicrobiia bacterium]|jgi:uncharacterized membrane protein
MRKPVRALGLFGALVLVTVPMMAAAAQEVTTPTELRVSTPYVGVSIKPGDSASYAIAVSGPPGDRVDLSVDGLPDGWTATIKGGGFDLKEVLLDDTGRVSVDLDVDVPADTPDGDYSFAMLAEAESGTERLELSIGVAANAGGDVSLSTDFPSLQGSSDSSFSFSLDLDNGTPQEIQFGLNTEGPEGWQIEIRPSGESQASTVTVAGGASTTVTVDVDPPDTAPAGSYVVLAAAEGGGESAAVELGIEITGIFDIDLLTANDVLNVDVNAGQESTLDLVVHNTGSAPLQSVGLSSSPPSGWEVTFDVPSIDLIPPGESVPATATIVPADDAINGDYALTFTASVPEVRASTDIRATVQTSAAWGLVGVGVIVLALVGLTMVFRRYGRH